MRCPICGCKMKEEVMCPYCKITGEQVTFASNIEAKKRIKEKNTSEVYLSTTKPQDVSGLKLILYTIFFGFLGVNSFYVGRKYRGLTFLFCTLLSLSFSLLSNVNTNLGWNNYFITLFAKIFYILMAGVVLLWVLDIINVFVGIFKIPVVLADKDEIEKKVKRYER